MTKIAACLLLVLAWTTSLAAPAEESIYQLGAGDVISIKVFGEPELSFDNVRLTDSGTLPYPFLGEVQASGKTQKELEQSITRSLADGYLLNPRVTIHVVNYRQFFVNGEVKSPGGYAFQPGLTVRKAVALAGGMTQIASENKITIIHEADRRGDPARATLESAVYPGDIVTIGESLF